MTRTQGWLGAIAVGALLCAAAAVHERARVQAIRDRRLMLRVRATLGHFGSHPRSIRVTAVRGYVTLRGAVLAPERSDLVAAVRRVAGVRGLDDRLTSYLDAVGVPELQGGGEPERPARAAPTALASVLALRP